MYHIVIPARYGSTRLPAKALADINGKPLVYWVWRQAMQSKAVSVTVATDDVRIQEAMMIHAERAEFFSLRVKKLSLGLKELGFEIPLMPQGGFYLYVDISKFGLSSDEF